MPVKDRIKEIREVRAGDLLVNPDNFRGHPDHQRDAMAGVLEEIGNIDVLKAVETPAGLMLLDGHLRRGLLEEDTVKVAVLDLTPEEAKKALLTFDRVTALADLDTQVLAGLMDSVAMEDARVASMMTDWREGADFSLPADAVAPEEFPAVDSDIHVDYQCPRCAFGWSGNPRPQSDRAAETMSGQVSGQAS